MNKSDLIDVIAGSAAISKNIAGKTFDKLLEAITHALKKGEDVTLIGFGTFKVNDRKARTGRNPKTGAVLQIAASKVVAFKVGKGLKDAVQAAGQKE
ncbi:MAG: HU family DNA-binding protein [Rickettsiella sp.]|nr:HU family DNA-binding protein [Rickettsiella sp.]